MSEAIGRRLWQVATSRWRLLAGLFCGLLALFPIPGRYGSLTREVVAWDVGVTVYLVLAGLLFVTEPIDRMEANSEAQQEGEWTIFSLTLAGVVISFAAIISTFSGASHENPEQKSLHVALVAVTLLLSWLMTHTTFAFRYAHEYYARERHGQDIDRGLDFPGEKRPDYLDFMYFSLVLGMTFQVSDVEITSRKFRRLAMVQGLLSFLFNTIIVALTVNLAAGLL